jgi:hypothetical protein
MEKNIKITKSSNDKMLKRYEAYAQKIKELKKEGK